jgi:hypothetical protein
MQVIQALLRDLGTERADLTAGVTYVCPPVFCPCPNGTGGPDAITAADPVPEDLRQALDAIRQATLGQPLTMQG